jgi:erythromycin esterase-like protein
MWANWETVALAEWLRVHNDRHGDKVGFWFRCLQPLGVFDEVLKYLEEKDRNKKKAALDAFNCFEPYKEGKDRNTPLRRAVSLSCEDEVVNLLTKKGDIFPLIIRSEDIERQTKCTGNC